MLALQYGDGFLELANPAGVVTKWVSTAFNNSDDLLGSGNDLSFDLADTPGNHVRLGFANQLANRLARKDIEVVIWLFGMPWKRCIFTFNLKNGRISGYTKIDNGTFADVIKKQDICQPFIKTKDGSFEDHNWISLGNTANDAVASVMNSLTPGAAPYTFYPFINQSLFGEYSGVEGAQQWTQPRVINNWHTGGFRVGTTLPEVLKDHWFCPAFYLTWVVTKICEYLGFEVLGDFFEDEFIKSLVIDNNSVYSMTDIFNEFGSKLAPARHLPRIKLNEFFKILREDFRIMYYFNSDTKQAHFNLGKNALQSSERIDLTACIDSQFPTTDKIPETGFELTQGIDEDDELFEILPYVKSYFIGGDRVQKKIEIPLATCFMRRETNADSDTDPIWRIPMKKQVGNAYSDRAVESKAHNPVDYGRNKFALRFLSYRGMVNDSEGNPYPYATGDGKAPDGVTEICPSLWLGGTNGILENYQRSWFTFLIRTELVKLRAYLTNIILCSLSPIKKIRFISKEGVQLEAFLDSVEFQPTDDSKLKSDISVYPNYNSSGADQAINLDFVSGEIVNENLVYVKLLTVETDRVFRRPFFLGRILYFINADVIAEFYSDADGTVPYGVNGLVLNIITEHVISGKFSAETKQYTCYGETFECINNLTTYYHKGSSTNTRSVKLAEGKGYYRI